MGKTKSNKKFSGSSVRPNPMNLASIVTEDDLENGGEDVWQRIIQQLQSASSEEREFGCTGLSIIGRKKSATETILSKKIIRIVAPLMLDKNLSVQNAAVGALRNISLVDPEASERMVDQDVMTPLTKLLQNYNIEEWKAAEKATTKIDSKTEIFLEAVNLLWNLCEACEKAVKITHQNNLIEILAKHCNVDQFGKNVVIANLQCILTISEDCQEPILTELKKVENVIETLKRNPEESYGQLHIRLLSYAILLNIGEASGDQKEGLMSEIVKLISIILQTDQRQLVHDFSSALPLNDLEESSNEENMECDDQLERHQILRDQLNHVILSQQTALEILTNILCDDSNDQVEEWSDTEEDEEPGEEIMDATDFSTNSNVSVEIVEAIKAENVLEKVIKKAILPAENVQEILKSEESKRNDGFMVLKMTETLQTKAFLCLNNLIDSLAIDDLGGNDALFEVWKNLGHLSFNSRISEQVLEASTSAMRAANQKLCNAKAPQIDLLGQNELEQLANCKVECINVQVNVISMLGAIGQVISNGEIKAMVAKYLLEIASKEPQLRVVTEALDKIFDMFAEDDTDQLAAQVHLVERLKILQPGFKTKMGVYRQRSQKCDAETVAMANMVKNNFGRFIKYKEKRLAGHQNGSK